MAKYKDPNSWSNGGNKRRDFQHTHDGPEELPVKKKKKKAGRKKARCEHDYAIIAESTWAFRTPFSYREIIYRCSKCGKKRYEHSVIDDRW